MKKNLIFLLGLICIANNVFSQENPDKVKSNISVEASLIYAPIGTTFFESETPFEIGNALYAGISIVKDRLIISPYYSFGSNSAGSFFSYDLNGSISSYLVFDKNLNDENGLVGVGFTTVSWNPNILPFIELGQTFGNSSDTYASIGIYFLFNTKI